MKRFDLHLDDKVARGVRAEAAARGQSVNEHLRRRISIGYEPPPYRFSGPVSEPSFIRDLALVQGWREGESVDADEATERLRRFSRWTEDHPISFAPITTGDAGAIIPAGYRTAVTIPMTTDRPLVEATERLPIASAASFTVPTSAGDGTVEEGRVEGENAAGDDPTFDTVTVSPKGLSGVIDLTRELVDSSSPGGDAIALATMREDWYRQAEAMIYTELNTVQSGTITAGFVASGAQARTSTTPATNLLIDTRKAVLDYANVRRKKARNVVAGAAALTHLGGLLDSDTGDETSLARIYGARLNGAVNDFGTTSSDLRVAILGADDVVSFESPLAEFRFDETAGPALVRCAVWGYFGVVAARPRGLSSIRFA